MPVRIDDLGPQIKTIIDSLADAKIPTDAEWSAVAGGAGFSIGKLDVVATSYVVDTAELTANTITIIKNTGNAVATITSLGAETFDGANSFVLPNTATERWWALLIPIDGKTNWSVVTAKDQVPNVAPTVSFTESSAGLVLTLDGSASTDPDGTIDHFVWTLDDNVNPPIILPGQTANESYTFLAPVANLSITCTVFDNVNSSISLTHNNIVISASTKIHEYNFTTLGLSDGAEILSVSDLGSDGEDFSATGGTAPTFELATKSLVNTATKFMETLTAAAFKRIHQGLDCTLSFVLSIDSLQSGFPIFMANRTTAAEIGTAIYWASGGAKLGHFLNADNDVAWSKTGLALGDGSFHPVSMTIASGVVKTYINNVLVNTATTGFSGQSVPTNATSKMRLGQYPSGTAGGRFRIKHLQLDDHVFDAGEISAYNTMGLAL